MGMQRGGRRISASPTQNTQRLLVEKDKLFFKFGGITPGNSGNLEEWW